MVVPKKEKRSVKTIDDLEKEAKLDVNKGRATQQGIQKKISEKYLDANFYFSVVFATKDDRDAYCKSHGIKLLDDDYVFGNDYEITRKEVKS